MARQKACPHRRIGEQIDTAYETVFALVRRIGAVKQLDTRTLDRLKVDLAELQTEIGALQGLRIAATGFNTITEFRTVIVKKPEAA